MGELLHLLLVFLQIGLFSIGGGYAIIPFIQDLVVEKYTWISQQAFTDMITISQMTPGPLAVNISTFVGLQIAGIPGAMLSTFGCVISGVGISILLYRFFKRFNQSVYAVESLNVLKAASLGLIISAAATLLLLTFLGTSAISVASKVDWMAVTVLIGSLIVLRKWKMNPILLMVLTGIVGALIQ
ncbi:chromate transporter [Paenibacillus sp. 1001270B_150601_E10]|uniref:chromate transporter n=1 Tax=Paenibacillus sp. 1001270B_150601_E10 TaxID=2787079 RepID=UPI00189DA459|nr:chromate transporter [Paenibacillus sp. 1001270B_150601_E10]